jgi:FkbM family methyltransferase
MLDVGAHHGGSLERFASDGWRVFAFEPDPDNRLRLHHRCRSYETVSVDARAVSNCDGAQARFYQSNVSTGISSLSPFHPSHTSSIRVHTVTLSRFLSDSRVDSVDFLKIDTEGHDLFVLQGFPWQSIRPRAILCEFENKKTIPVGYSFHDLAQYLTERHFRVLVSEWYPILRYGGQHRWHRFANYPCQLHDENGWGNLLAVASDCDYRRLAELARAATRRLTLTRALVRTRHF